MRPGAGGPVGSTKRLGSALFSQTPWARALMRVATSTEPGKHSVAPVANRTQVAGGPKRLDSTADNDIPILRGQEDEDLCASLPH